MSTPTIDINADLGEGSGNDAQIMPLISSCSIACGGHYGEANSMRSTIRLAKKHQVKIGAHPAFPDMENFGRKMLYLSKSELQKSLNEQLENFQEICQQEEVQINHIKPHGALYNQGSNRKDYVSAMIEAFGKVKDSPALYLQKDSLLYRSAKDSFPIKLEAFIDRTYANEKSLASRTLANAIISDPNDAWNQLISIFENQTAIAINGNRIRIQADTFCIHGDQAHAVKTLRFIHKKLKEKQIELS